MGAWSARCWSRRGTAISSEPGALLIAGGAGDPHLAALAAAAGRAGRPVLALLNRAEGAPRLTFDPAAGTLQVDGAPAPRVAAAFLRPDVFAPAEARAGYAAEGAAMLGLLRGWLPAAEIRRFNADPFGRGRSVAKGAALAAAARAGLAIPETLVSDDPAALAAFAAAGERVAKPVLGGAHCRPLAPGEAAGPAVIAQARVRGPDLRVFRVGRAFLGFELRSPALDYREDPRPEIAAVRVPEEIVRPLLALTDAMGLDWCASDFKRPAEGPPVYLETNANPMFAAFDRVARGALADEMLRALLTPPGAGP